jgi:hypothetical protein
MANNIHVTVHVSQNALIELLATDNVRDRMDDVADAALAIQKSLVPVDTGNLSRHLEKRKSGVNNLNRQVGAFDVDYAAAVETGHQTRSGSWVAAQPYIRPSMNAVRKGLG